MEDVVHRAVVQGQRAVRLPPSFSEGHVAPLFFLKSDHSHVSRNHISPTHMNVTFPYTNFWHDNLYI